VAKITPIDPKPGDLVWFNQKNKAFVSGPYRFLKKDTYLDLHTKQEVKPAGMPCKIEAECVFYGADTEMAQRLQKHIAEEINGTS